MQRDYEILRSQRAAAGSRRRQSEARADGRIEGQRDRRGCLATPTPATTTTTTTTMLSVP